MGADFFGKVIARCTVFCDLFYQCGKGQGAHARKKIATQKKFGFRLVMTCGAFIKAVPYSLSIKRGYL